MSKAILIVDMPHNMCRQCKLFQSITIFHSVTYWCGGKSLIIDNPNEIQDFCPLKPMPVKKVPMFNPNDCDIEEEKQIVHEIYGYNVCIDEIYESDEE